uniref:Small integral membrane protein 26 n=1 Tax=Mastacembelus armatus TaxID=205130 RepID=A0A3Q3KYH4_9TELE
MSLKDLAKWNIRLSAVYAVGVWTMIGSYAYFRYTGLKQEEEQPEDPNQVTYRTAHTNTIITYRKDFVPYTTRIYNFIALFSGDSGTGDSKNEPQ